MSDNKVVLAMCWGDQYQHVLYSIAATRAEAEKQLKAHSNYRELPTAEFEVSWLAQDSAVKTSMNNFLEFLWSYRPHKHEAEQAPDDVLLDMEAA